MNIISSSTVPSSKAWGIVTSFGRRPGRRKRESLVGHISASDIVTATARLVFGAEVADTRRISYRIQGGIRKAVYTVTAWRVGLSTAPLRRT